MKRKHASATAIATRSCRSNRVARFAFAVFVAAVLYGGVSCSPTPTREGLPSFRDAPVFYEMFWADYADEQNLLLLPDGKVNLKPLGVESIEGFDWVHHTRRDPSWWLRIENFAYLFSTMASDEKRHRDFVRGWFEGWLQAHEENAYINTGTRDAMTVGKRTMAFTWYLKQLESAGDSDEGLAEGLRSSIKRDQDYLKDHRNFSARSNHGMWEALGLFESTRVHADSALTTLALKRLVMIATKSVSSQGFHKEHSPSYHFWFLKWMREYADYFLALDGLEWEQLSAFVALKDAMEEKAYYLYDHRQRLPKIGDTDGKRIQDPPPVPDPVLAAVLDREAGYAIYKGLPGTDDKRYVVFCVQNKANPPELPFHFHNDLLSVCYSYDGEIILSDQGRYSYAPGNVRNYYKSAAAHNTIALAMDLFGRGGSLRLADRVWWEKGEVGDVFGARTVGGEIERTVSMPRGEPRLVVEDRVENEYPQNLSDRLPRGARQNFAIHWYVGPDVVQLQAEPVTREPGGRKVYGWTLETKRGRRFSLDVVVRGETSNENIVDVIEGQKTPYLGWYSPRYNESVPIPLIRFRLARFDTVNVRTTLVRIP